MTNDQEWDCWEFRLPDDAVRRHLSKLPSGAEFNYYWAFSKGVFREVFGLGRKRLPGLIARHYSPAPGTYLVAVPIFRDSIPALVTIKFDSVGDTLVANGQRIDNVSRVAASLVFEGREGGGGGTGGGEMGTGGTGGGEGAGGGIPFGDEGLFTFCCDACFGTHALLDEVGLGGLLGGVNFHTDFDDFCCGGGCKF